MSNDCHIDEAKFRDRLDCLFDPNQYRALSDRGEVNIGGENFEEAILAAMENLDELPEYQPRRVFDAEDYEGIEVTPIVPDYVSRYDRAFAERRRLTVALENLTPADDLYHPTMAKLAEAEKRYRAELANSTDDQHRDREKIDEWKATTGREDYNTSRRNRTEPNKMTPKATLESETPEQKKDRLRARDSERKRERRKNAKKGKSLGSS